MSEKNIKRLFFGMNAEASWPEKLPEGRIIEEPHRHFTFVFIGDEEIEGLLSQLDAFPPPPFKVGLAGFFDACLSFPPRHPHVVAWRANFGRKQEAFLSYQKEAVEWLIARGFGEKKSERDYIPHATLCRSPFDATQWKKAFHPLPVKSDTLHLFESLGHSKYNSLWQLNLLPPFQELPHTADLAFHIRSESLQEMYWNACMALAFHYPELLKYFPLDAAINDLNEIIIELNNAIGLADSECGSPYKAVSFHGDIIKENDLLEWEMIVDV